MLHDLRCILKSSFMENQCKNLVDWRTGSRTVQTNREFEDSSDRETNSIIRVVMVYPQLWNVQLTLVSMRWVDIESKVVLCPDPTPWHSLGFPLLLKLWRRLLTRPIHSRASAAQCSPSLDSSQDEIPTASPGSSQEDESFLIWSKGWRISGGAEFVDAEFGLLCMWSGSY
jgi:hypothetical protein